MDALALIGVAIGLAGAFALTRLLASLFFQGTARQVTFAVSHVSDRRVLWLATSPAGGRPKSIHCGLRMSENFRSQISNLKSEMRMRKASWNH